MKKAAYVVVLILMVVFILPQDISAETNISAGLQFTGPFWGISAIYDFSESMAVQGIVSLRTLGVKGIFRPVKDTYWNIYAYGALGVRIHDYGFSMRNSLGGGFEFDWMLFGIDLEEVFNIKDLSLRQNIELGWGVWEGKIHPGIGLGVFYNF